MRFKEGDKVEFIYGGTLTQGVVTEIRATNHDISYLVEYGEKGEKIWITERDLVAPAPVLKVPQFVADWYEQHRHKLEYSIWGYIYDWDNQDCESDFYDFMENDNLKPVETLIKMKDGYEVEKEPLYYVQLITIFFGYLNERNDGRRSLSDSVQNDIFKTQFTEAEIKAMDERYWQFAVPVKEVEGGA
ncbi:DUF1642 domain-containing protein [Listeria monocytogenes]|nr:DUF1642 domain-containing protein [Listeria monocytogenes]EAD8962190.1 DUF1642 domain-containing protein [Listeria monocytogenes]EHD1716978.1 DUF1642 domain-containing protein [Listeria monocytogenes]EIY6095631.1 DUF1642 domain-containing protein [Listeria monocytogenes]HAO5805490.1 DUF1642 domain-containing protein [Listeria monocytogenes]